VFQQFPYAIFRPEEVFIPQSVEFLTILEGNDPMHYLFQHGHNVFSENAELTNLISHFNCFTLSIGSAYLFMIVWWSVFIFCVT
jgi:hypothetical protein